MKEINICDNWLFYRGRTPDKKTTVNLPHDAMITERRGPNAPSGTAGAYFYGDVYTYEKELDAPKEWSSKRIVIEFEGAYCKTTVYVNGEKVGFEPYGYTNFYFDISDYLKYGEKNVIKAQVDNSEMSNSRWYSGSGLYRPVKLHILEKDGIELNGITVITKSIDPAVVCVNTVVSDSFSGEVSVEIQKDGVTVANGFGTGAEIEIPNAKLWSEDTPELYTAKVTAKNGDTVVDEVCETFGIRSLSWSKEGLFVNGKRVLLRGGCVHHDNGILGAACEPDAEYRKVRIMKENGYNAIRSAHNPCSKYMLEACDRYGVYMVNEAYDMWFVHKTPHDNADYFDTTWKTTVKNMVEASRNHPSVIMYSLVNEPSETSSKRGLEVEKNMYNFIKQLDSARMVTIGLNPILATAAVVGATAGYTKDNFKEDKYDENGRVILDKKKKVKTVNGSFIFNMAFGFFGPMMNYMPANALTTRVVKPIENYVDVLGYNYGFGRYRGDMRRGKLIMGSETLPMDIYRNWKAVRKHRGCIGDFMWTGWDYLGEVGAGGWSYVNDGMMMMKDYPYLIADAGAIDLIGYPGAECRYAATVWEQTSKPVICVKPVNHPGVEPMKTMWRGTNAVESWSWKDCTGNDAEVEVYTQAAMVELFVNGVSKGVKAPEKCIAVFHVKYEPGEIKAVALNASGVKINESTLVSAESKLQIALREEDFSLTPGDLLFVHVDITDENGIIESNADTEIDVSVNGGDLLAFGSAVQSTEDRFTKGHYRTRDGRALAIIRKEGDNTVTVTATSGEMGTFVKTF